MTKSFQELIDLLGPDVVTPEMKAALTEMAAPMIDVATGAKSGIAHIVEKSGIDEGDVIDVLLALETMPMPNAIADRLIEHGFVQDDIPKIDIGIKRVAMALVRQHVGLLTPKNRQTDEEEHPDG